ncbi:MAG: hypothetical protein ACP5H0_06530 [Caldisericum sp.]|uniref:hypothetical protein n=1 Tax=Caldisericum sp. TaxID=2499687 RepID=UPI003D0A1051
MIKVGIVQPEYTPVGIATSGLHGIYLYRQMPVFETGNSYVSDGERITSYFIWGLEIIEKQ